MGVQVDQAGNQDVVLQNDPLSWIEAVACFPSGQHVHDSSIVDGDSMVFENHIGVDRGNPARLE